MGINKVILVGNLGKDPEVKEMENGLKVARFPLATSEFYRDRASGERKEKTEWHNIVCWRNLADIAANYLKKGQSVYIEGKIKSRSWEDAGIKKYITEIVVDNLQMLGVKSPSVSVANESNPEMPDNISSSEEDELPF